MKTRPTVFLSAVSHELQHWRDAAAAEVTRKGCFAENQSTSFAPDHRTVAGLLRAKLQDADAVVHIAGFRFGAEPAQRPADAPRRSYTQLEVDIALDLGIPVYRFVVANPALRDPPLPGEAPEDAEATALQQAHRAALQATNHLYYPVHSLDELRRLVAEIPPLQGSAFFADIARIGRYAPPALIGRDDELRTLDAAWAQVRSGERTPQGRAQVLGFVALGGEGKTSLVAHWLAGMAASNWPGCDAVIAWSFYSQGSRETQAGSSDLFLREALIRFGDADLANSPTGAYEKGQRLAQLVGERRALLVLDGLEPLQYPPTSPLAGELKDPGLSALLLGLAANSRGLCVLTTRYAVKELLSYQAGTAPQLELKSLSDEAGTALLRSLGVTGMPDEFLALVQQVRGHALTLNLLGTYLRDAHAGDIRKRDRVTLAEADDEQQGGHAFRVMAAYGTWLQADGAKGQRAWAMLCLLGLFDRPASADCLAALWRAPAITGLTDALVGLTDAQRNVALSRLQAARLLTVNRDPAGALVSLDAHPLLREYLAGELTRLQPEAWRAGHARLFEHLCETTHEGPEPSLEDLLPLYQAVVHGCLAGLQQQACDEVYRDRILRGSEYYITQKLGGFGPDLGAVAMFFEPSWQRVSPALSSSDQAWLLGAAAFRLRALGRLGEALEPMRSSLAMYEQQTDLPNAAISAGNLSELALRLGDTVAAHSNAEVAVRHADSRSDAFQQMTSRITQADALHQAGQSAAAKRLFVTAEQMQADHQPGYRWLYSTRGFQYCDLLLSPAERAAWRASRASAGPALPVQLVDTTATMVEVALRATQSLAWAEQFGSLLDIALGQLTLARTALLDALLTCKPSAAGPRLNLAVDFLRRAGTRDYLPCGLLTRSWYRHTTGHPTGPDSAQTDLDEAWSIAARGPMPLFQADIHLHRARLFGPHHAGPGQPPYPWTSATHDLQEARRLIEKHGYGRRLEELQDAEAAAAHWPGNQPLPPTLTAT